MVKKSLVLLFTTLAMIGQWSCGDNNNQTADDTGSAPIDTGSINETDDEDTGSETIEDEVGPVLPELCALIRPQSPVSESILDGEPGTRGDGRSPRIGFGETTLMTWGYLASDDFAVWEIQVGPYTPSEDIDTDLEPVPSTDEITDRLAPATKAKAAQKPSIAANGNRFGIVWIDARYDTACDNPADCNYEIAFIDVDETGMPNPGPQKDPVRVTRESIVMLPPSIAAYKDGYVVTWLEQNSDSPTIMGCLLSAQGEPGEPFLVASDLINDSWNPGVAVLDEVIMFTWATYAPLQTAVRSFQDGQLGEKQIIAEGAESPTIIAGDNSFLASWTKRTTDAELFTVKLDTGGVPQGQPNRITWTDVDVADNDLAYNGSTYAIIWTSPKANGTDDYVEDSKENQVFMTSLDEDGAPVSAPVLVSKDPNKCSNPHISWDGSGWTAVWEVNRNARRQVYYGRIMCQ